jgi:hypothetical protein
MTSRDRRRYDMLTRVRSFGILYGQRFSTNSPAHQALAVVSAEIDRLDALDVAERSTLEISRATRKAAARKVFQRILTRAGATARVLGKTIPQLQARISLPLPPEDLPLLTVARQFAADAVGYEPPFAAHGLPLPVLAAAIAAFEQAIQQRGSGREGRVRVRAEIEMSFTCAMHAVETLDVVVANCLGEDAVAIAVWKHDRRVKAPRRGGAAATEPALALVPYQRQETAARPRAVAA